MLYLKVTKKLPNKLLITSKTIRDVDIELANNLFMEEVKRHKVYPVLRDSSGNKIAENSEFIITLTKKEK